RDRSRGRDGPAGPRGAGSARPPRRRARGGRPCAAPPRRARARPAARPRPARPRPWGGAPRRRRRGPSARPSAPAEHASEQSSRRPRRSWGLFYTAAMKRSLQEYVELVVFGLVALLVGTG